MNYIYKYANNKFYGGNYYKILSRDGYKCVNCGSTDNLNVHHIIGLRDNDSRSVDISSMVTLCRKCHSKEHYMPNSIVTDLILENIGFDFILKKFINEIRNNLHAKKHETTHKYL